MKNLLYSDESTNIIKQAAQETMARENLKFLIDLAIITMVADDTKSTDDEPQTQTWNHKESGKRRSFVM